jgi:molybdopterin-containing oxidoreductase family iron-sulfur binding subunit
MKDEFPEDAAEWLDPVSRRQFLTLMGASVALAGAVGCNPSVRPAPQRNVIPYVNQPDQIVAGVPLYFATAIPQAGGVGLGLLVRSNMGRPTKIEGNPNHPGSLGATNVYAQGSLLSMYDPDRSKEVLKNGVASSFDSAIDGIRAAMDAQAAKKGAGVRIVTEPITSPTLAGLIGQFLERYPAAKWIQYEPTARDGARRATVAAFGKPLNPIYHFDQAKVILALDSDFLSASGPAEVRYARDCMAKRRVRTVDAARHANDGVPADAGQMNRLYAVEAMLTNTGAVADHRLPLKPSQVEGFARAVAAAFGVAGVAAPADLPELAKKWVGPLVDDLKAAGKQAVVIAGDSQPPAVHLLAHAINEKLGAIGTTITFTDPVEPRPASDHLGDFRNLVAEMNDKKVEVLFLFGGNPVYDAPADLNFVQALNNVPDRFHWGLYADETAAHCNWHVNAAHYLESWADVRAYDGTATVMQPLMAPIYGGKSLIDLFALLLNLGESNPLSVVKAQWKKHFDSAVKAGDFDGWFDRAVRDGVVPGTALKPVSAGAVNLGQLNALATPPVTGDEIQFRADPTIYDGRYANNGWLQELPKPVTKLTWDNAAIMSPATARKYKFEIGYGWKGGENGRTIANVGEFTLGDRKIKAAVLILPGHADDCVTIYLGYGRTRAGRIGSPADARVGFDAYPLRTSNALWYAGGLKVDKTREDYFLACVFSYSLMESRRPARYATVDQFKRWPDFAQVPAATPGEYKDLRALTPGTQEDWTRLYGSGADAPAYPYAKDAAHAHAASQKTKPEEEGVAEHAEHGHDSRVIPLNLYPDYPQQVNGEPANKTYRRWGMSIDLNACTGCSTCVIACVSENNTPVIGKEQVTRGRAMHWLRIDRYFTIPGDHLMDDRLGDQTVKTDVRAERVLNSAAIETHFQPNMCQQCEKAPCEIVCPVGATVHSADGLNDMVFNRCVGTRYCSNNCPYKARRFNFLQYADYSTESLKLMRNPEVTVRQRGVMEKCTYCVQRIRNAEIEAEREFQTRPKNPKTGRPMIFDGEVVTACQAACPTNAIVFGDLNDLGSRVLREKAEPHAYGLLAELNTMPRTSYLAQIRNPNPKMPQGA